MWIFRHRQAVEGLAEIDRDPLVGQGDAADDVLRHLPEQRLGEVHQIVVVLISLVELEHREFGVVPGRDALVAEIAVDLEHLLHAADDELLEVELRRDAQEKLHVERVVVRGERSRCSAAGDRVHHRRLDLEITPRDEKLADRLHDLRPPDEHFARLRVRDEVDVALPVALFLVGQAVELLG